MKTQHKLTATAEKMNQKLVAAGCSEQWVFDDDQCSNSVGTWFCGSLGGVRDAKSMRDETERLIAIWAKARTEWRSVQSIRRDQDGTAYITDLDGKTRIYAIELDNGEGWVLERQLVAGDENPERLSEHETEDEAMAELITYASPKKGKSI